MPPSAPATVDSLVPVLRYRDVDAAARWLTAAFGFELKTLVKADDIPNRENEHGAELAAATGAIYAELMHGRGTIMLVPVGQSDLDAHMRQPDELGGVETQTCYVTVADPASHLQRAVESGAEVVLPLSGGPGEQFGYSCRDLEGHLWNFGTYAPSTAAIEIPRTAVAASEKASQKNGSRWIAPALTLSLLGLAGWAWFMLGNPLSSLSGSSRSQTSGSSPMAASPGTLVGTANQADAQWETPRSQNTVLKLRQDVTEARAAVKAAEDAANAATKDLAAEYARRTDAVQKGESAAAKVIKLEADLAASKEALAHLESELLKERSARGQSVQAADTARNALEQEIKRREQLEHLVQELDGKADGRLQTKLDNARVPPPPSQKNLSAAPQSTVKDPAAASSSASTAPSVTGSIGTPEPAAPPTASAPSPSQTAMPADPPKREKAAAAKRPRSGTQSATSSKSSKAASKEEKSWPYSGW